MSLLRTISVINHLAEQGVIKKYALMGAVGALNYIQPMLTEDVDILISVGDFDARKSGLILLTPIEDTLEKLGYNQRSDVGIWVEGWPVQFLPVASPLDEEALLQAVQVPLEREGEEAIKVWTLKAEHLAAIALKVGRLKDFARVEAFIEQKALALREFKEILQRHDLMPAWKLFCFKTGRADFLS